MEQYDNLRDPTSALPPFYVMRGTTTPNLSQPQDSASGTTLGVVKMDFVKVGLLLFFLGLGNPEDNWTQCIFSFFFLFCITSKRKYFQKYKNYIEKNDY